MGASNLARTNSLTSPRTNTKLRLVWDGYQSPLMVCQPLANTCTSVKSWLTPLTGAPRVQRRQSRTTDSAAVVGLSAPLEALRAHGRLPLVLKSLSEQQIVDCSTQNLGCQCGNAGYAVND